MLVTMGAQELDDILQPTAAGLGGTCWQLSLEESSFMVYYGFCSFYFPVNSLKIVNMLLWLADIMSICQKKMPCEPGYANWFGGCIWKDMGNLCSENFGQMVWFNTDELSLWDRAQESSSLVRAHEDLYKLSWGGISHPKWISQWRNESWPKGVAMKKMSFWLRTPTIIVGRHTSGFGG